MTVKPIRDGFHTVTPYLLVAGAARLITFVADAFDAQILSRETRPDGEIMHAEVRVGDSMVMIGEASDEFPSMPASTYLYVPNCDVVYHRALQAGGSSVFAITDLTSGERYGGVKDPCDNIWWIATHVAYVPADEQAKGWAEFKR